MATFGGACIKVRACGQSHGHCPHFTHSDHCISWQAEATKVHWYLAPGEGTWIMSLLVGS